MNTISLKADGIIDVTIVPNIFIDRYMPSANGAYVKVYLYLLRSLHGSQQALSISSIADHLENTEADITRSLSYWEKLGLLNIDYNEKKDIVAIHFVNLEEATSATTNFGSNSEAAVAMEEPIPEKPVYQKPDRQNYSAEQTAELTNSDEIQWTMHIVELYLDRPLKTMDIQLILYLYDRLNFSPELIMYLYEYCVSKGKKNASYIEAVALTWAEQGIDTEEKAKEATATYNDHFNAVNKAFGLNRAPGQIERQYISKWVDTYGFSDEMIVEACNRTILRTQKPDFKYADKILETWYKKGAKNKADIDRLDEEFSKKHKTFDPNRPTRTSKPSTNKFNQFPQRTYTAQDYADLERKLLNKGL